MMFKAPRPFSWILLPFSLVAVTSHVYPEPAIAQNPDPASVPQQDILPPSPQPELAPQQPLQLPPPEELLQPAPPPSTETEPPPGDVPDALLIRQFQVEGSTVFDPDVLAEVARRAVAPRETDTDQPDGSDVVVDRPLSFAELLQARSAITDYYTSNGYVTSGAFIPPQQLQDGVVIIQVVEGTLEEINITGTGRLNPNYVRSRIERAASAPLNVPRLLEGLQLLQLDPLIQSISADLQAGTRPGTSVLEVEVAEADTFNVDLAIDNNRSPSVGSFRRQIQVGEANLFGQGDSIRLGYSNTDGSDSLDASYTYPLNPRNGTLRLAFGTTSSEVIEDPFDVLNIEADSRFYELTVRQPLFQSPTEEFAVGLTASRQESEAEYTPPGSETLAFPSLGADEEGRTRISALRFFQEWTQRSSQHVLAARSQFSLGLDALNSTINEEGPDSRFFAWRGQGQWVRLLAPDTLLLVRGDVQLADGSLVPLEQFGLGGQETIRGYRQDVLLTDNGALMSAEVRLPVVRAPEIAGLLQVIPFIDIGTAWNAEAEDPDPRTLVGVGLGIQWRQGDRFSARLDWGIPLVEVDAQERTWQENGLYFSVIYSPF